VRLTIKAVNEALAKRGSGARLEKGDRYFYFSGGEATDWLDRTVKAHSLSSLSLDQWMAEFDRLKRFNDDTLRAPARTESTEVGRPAEPRAAAVDTSRPTKRPAVPNSAASAIDPSHAVEATTTWTTWRPIANEPSSEVAAAIVRGVESGPTLWLQGAIYGNEVDSAVLVQQVVAAVDARSLRGTLIAIPVVNGAAFAARQRDAPKDAKDANRQFPGRPDGSYSERLAYAISSSVEAHADALVDVHSSTETVLALSHCVYFASDSDVSHRSKALAWRSGVDVIWESSGNYLPKALSSWTVQRGILSALLDVGDLDSAPGAVARALNMLAFVGMLPDPGLQTREPYAVLEPRWAVADHDGIVSQRVAPGDRVAKGGSLFDVLDVRGRTLQSIVSELDVALVLATRRHKHVAKGDQVVSLGAITHDPRTLARNPP
jgi:predicted deacylase